MTGLGRRLTWTRLSRRAGPPWTPPLPVTLTWRRAWPAWGHCCETGSGRTGAQADWDGALSLYAQAAEVDEAPPSDRILAARAAALLAAHSEPGRAASLLQAAVRLLPQVAPRQLERSDQEYAIGRFAGLAGSAAALALADPGIASGERAARALGLLEAGRAVLLSQALDTRSDLTDLRHQYPDLAGRFAELRDRLDQPSGESAARTPLTSSDSDQPDREAQDRYRLANELTAVIEQIRSPGRVRLLRSAPHHQ